LEKVSSNRDLKAAGVEEKASDNEFNFDDWILRLNKFFQNIE
jgi:hypothetical protein